MLAIRLLVLAAAALVPLACSSEPLAPDGGLNGGSGGSGGSAQSAGAGGAGALDGGNDAGGAGAQSDDDALIVPQGLNVMLEPGGAGVLDLVALTLAEGPDGLDLYASLTNDGDVPACDAALKVQLFDTTGQPLGEWINGLYTSHFYLYTPSGGSTTVAACASPGDVTMTRISTMATGIALADVAQVVYYYSYFALDAVLTDGLTVSGLGAVTGGAGTSYMGTMTNQLDMMVSDPSVTVFSLTGVGRPIGMTSASDTSQVPAGGSWPFQTDPIDTAGVGFAAFPSASFSN